MVGAVVELPPVPRSVQGTADIDERCTGRFALQDIEGQLQSFLLPGRCIGVCGKPFL